jgi:hypothetical protein
VLSLLCAAIALAAPPSNDNRADAQPVQLGSTVSGTTTEATTEESEPESGCVAPGPSVWYRVDAARDGRVIALVQASGDLDVVMDVYLRERSQLTNLTCDTNDRRGQASADFQLRRGESYLIRVAQRTNSVPGDFRLTVDLAQPAATPPGRPLPRNGGNGTVQRVFEPSDAWSMSLREGVTYRINLAARTCVSVSVYPPGTRSFARSPVRTSRCGGYLAFTPGPDRGGTYSFLVSPGSSGRAARPYHLAVGPATSDDTTPGVFVRNHARVRGVVNAGHLDVIDLYRFDVLRPSITDLSLRARGDQDLDLILVGVRGRRIACACGSSGREEINVRTPRGRFYAVVRAARGASGRYSLARASKTITRTRLSAEPRRSEPGRPVELNVAVPPGVSGPATIVVERFDPLNGYQFLRTLRVRVRAGRGSVRFDPPSVGRYRARARFLGTRNAARSASGLEEFSVERPLQE